MKIGANLPTLLTNTGRPRKPPAVSQKKVKSREKNLERFENSADRVEKPRQQWRTTLDLDSARRSDNLLVSIPNVVFGYDEIPIFESLSAELRYGQRVALMGQTARERSLFSDC